MSWAIVAVGTVAAVGAGVSASQANKRAKSVGNSLNESIAFARRDPAGVFGEKIDFEGVDYNALYRGDPGYANMAGDVTRGNQRNLPDILRLTSETNRGITQDSLNRINTLYPGFQESFAQQSQNTQNFLRGDIPQEDRDMLASRRSEAIALGGGGNTGQQTAADLGLARMDLMERGAAGLTNNTNLLNSIDPLSRHLTPQSSFVDVGQAINSAVAENQFASTFAASERDAEFNASLIPDPQKRGMLDLLSARAGLQAANPQQSVAMAAGMAGLTAGMGAYASGQTAAAAQQRAAASAPQQQYVQAAQQPVQYAYASPADQQAGIRSLSGTGVGGGSMASPYNANTGNSFGEQGGLWSYYNSGASGKKYSFQ